MPLMAVLLGLLSLVPFVWFGLEAVGVDPDTATRSLAALVDYAALILTFAGGVHWGLGLAPGAPRPVIRFAAGVAPLIIAWAALITAQMTRGIVALPILMVGYVVSIVTERRAGRLVPMRYLWLRWCVSGVALVVMAGVLLLRGVGQTIVF